MTEFNPSDRPAAAVSPQLTSSPPVVPALVPILFLAASLVLWLIPAVVVRADEGLEMLREGPVAMESTVGIAPQGGILLLSRAIR